MWKKNFLLLMFLFSFFPSSSYSFVIETELDIDPERRMIAMDYLSPISHDESNNAFLFSAALRIDDLDSIEGDLGGAYRRELSNNKILGVNYFVYARSAQNMLFNQHSIGFEYLTNLLDFRINKYMSLQGKPDIEILSAAVTNIVMGDVNTTFKYPPYVMDGYDASLGVNLGKLYTSATVSSFKGGPINFFSLKGGPINSYVGARGRIEVPIELADRAIMKMGAEIFGDNLKTNLNYRVFVGTKMFFGNKKKNAKTRLLTERIIRDRDIIIHNGKDQYSANFPKIVQSRHLIIEDPITGINREIPIGNEDIKIANSAAELDGFLRQVSAGTNDKLFLVQDNFASSEVLDVVSNPDIQNVFIAGSAAIKTSTTIGDIDYVFNPDRDFAKGNPIALNFKGLSGEQYTLHELSLNTLPQTTDGAPTYGSNVDISNCNISNLGSSGAFNIFRGENFRLNNVKVNDTYSNAAAIDNAYIAAISQTMHLRNVNIVSIRDIRINNTANNVHTGTAFFGRAAYTSSPSTEYRFHGQNSINSLNALPMWPTISNQRAVYLLSPGVSMFADVHTLQQPSTINIIYKHRDIQGVQEKLFTIVSTDPVASSAGVVIDPGDSASTSGPIADSVVLYLLVGKNSCC